MPRQNYYINWNQDEWKLGLQGEWKGMTKEWAEEDQVEF